MLPVTGSAVNSHAAREAKVMMPHPALSPGLAWPVIGKLGQDSTLAGAPIRARLEHRSGPAGMMSLTPRARIRPA